MSKIQQEQLEIKKYGIFDVVYQNYKRNEHNFSEEYKQELKNKIKQYKDQVNDRKNPSTKIFTEQEYK